MKLRTRQVLVWQVIAVIATGHGLGSCGHRHANADEATMCDWTPDPWPYVCDLLVRQVRDPELSGDPPRTRRVDRHRQLELFA